MVFGAELRGVLKVGGGIPVLIAFAVASYPLGSERKLVA